MLLHFVSIVVAVLLLLRLALLIATLFLVGHLVLLVVLVCHLEVLLKLVLVYIIVTLLVIVPLLVVLLLVARHFMLTLNLIILVGAEEIALAKLVALLAKLFLALLLLLHLKVVFVGRKLLLHEHLLGDFCLATAATRLPIIVVFSVVGLLVWLFHLHCFQFCILIC